MAHPKRRISKSAKGKRRSHLALSLSKPHHDPRTGKVTRSHRIAEDCTHYGFTKGGQGGSQVFESEDELGI